MWTSSDFLTATSLELKFNQESLPQTETFRIHHLLDRAAIASRNSDLSKYLIWYLRAHIIADCKNRLEVSWQEMRFFLKKIVDCELLLYHCFCNLWLQTSWNLF